jgi:DNA polymerase-1
MEKLVLIDGHSILNRAFYGVPPLSNSQGFPTNAIYGFLNILFKILDEEQPDYLVVAFDVHAPTFRHKMYEAYKGTRKPMPDDLREQVPVMKEVLQAMGITIVEQAGLEADDILGTLARKGEAEGMEVSLVSGDRDLLQIATDHIKIRIPKTKQGSTQIEDYYAADVLKTYQVTPTQFIELKALMGDTSDNIPGVPKVGEKTAAALMAEYGSLDEIYAHLEEISKKAIRESLRENRELADLSKELATIKTDCDLPVTLSQMKVSGFGTPEAVELFQKLGFQKLLSRIESEVSASAKAPDTVKDSFENTFYIEREPEKIKMLLEKASSDSQKQKPVGLMLLAEKRQLYGFALCLSQTETYFCPLDFVILEKEPDSDVKQEQGVQMSLFPQMQDELPSTKASTNHPDTVKKKPALSPSDSKSKVSSGMWEEWEEEEKGQEILRALYHLSEVREHIAVFDVKPTYDFFQQERIESYFDTLIGAYLLNPLKSDYTWEDIASEYLSLNPPSRQSLFGKEDWGEVWKHLDDSMESLKTYACYGAYTAFSSAPLIEAKLKATGMDHLMRDMEMPLTLVLYDMEKVGVEVRPQELKTFGAELTKSIGELEKAIYQQAGGSFNISSPKQLGVILFEKLQLPSGRKTKTGFSTSAEVLEKLAPEYPIVKDILEYRTLTKLKSTYADGLAAYIEGDSRIHSSFNQTITATGRISSTEPNLQNIPIRTQLGRQIRKVFVPKEGCVLADADYSQIELRIMAHMSGDEQLIEAYRTSMDIHRMTAAKVFHTPFEEVTSEQRRNAKAVNFGIIYGISAFGLSQDLSISRKEAEGYIEQYFATYPKVKAFLDEQVAIAKKKGYVTTLYGRRRPIPELSSSNHMQKAFGERVAMNSPIQGTAADIMKIAMIRVWKALKDGGFASKLILQVHDELLIETVLAEEEQVKKLLEENMSHAAELAVALEVDLHVGKNWYEAK